MLDLIAQNNHLRFIDARNDSQYVLDDLLVEVPEWQGEGKGLAFLYLDHGIDSIAAYLSFLQKRAALVLLNSSLDQVLKEQLEAAYRPWIIYDASRERIKPYKGSEYNSQRISLGIFEHEDSGTRVHENCKVLLSTSGTTGSPKLVKLSVTNLVENARSIADYLPIIPADVVPLNLPLYYSYGLSVFHSNAISGGTIVCGLPDILQKEFWVFLERYGFSSIAGVPFVYEMLHRIGFLRKTYPSLRYISQAGGNLNQKVKKLFLDYCLEQGIAFYVMYGQTEATARISYVPPDKLASHLTSIGKPIRNGKLYLDDETGELLYQGPNVFGGYAERGADLASWEAIPELRTGDLASEDEEGFFYIKGRLKRFVKIFGNRVNLDEVEAYLKTQISKGMLACMGINDQFILVAHTDREQDNGQLKQGMFNRFKIHQNSIKFYPIQDIPLTSNGKVDYKAITAAYQAADAG